MEFYLVRAFEIGRMDMGQIEKLHEMELAEQTGINYDASLGTYEKFIKRIPRALFPFEIQGKFGLKTLREQYFFPDDEGALRMFMERTRDKLREKGIAPKHDLSPGFQLFTDKKTGEKLPEPLHDFDWKVFNAVKDGTLSLYGEMKVSNKRRLKEEAA
jgi:hypothetical protein